MQWKQAGIKPKTTAIYRVCSSTKITQKKTNDYSGYIGFFKLGTSMAIKPDTQFQEL